MHCTYGYTRDEVAIEGLIDVEILLASMAFILFMIWKSWMDYTYLF